VQLRQSLRGMGYADQTAQLQPAAGAPPIQMMRRGDAPVQQVATASGPRAVQRRAVQRVETPPTTEQANNVDTTPTDTPDPNAQTPQEDLWDQAACQQWRGTFEIQIGNSLVSEATGTATTMARKVAAYMKEQHGALAPEAEGYRQAVQAIGAKLGKADLDRSTVWGGGVRPEDIERLLAEIETDKTAGFGLRERLFMCQQWYDNALTPDLVQSHEEVQKLAQKANMTTSAIDTFWQTARDKFKKAHGDVEESELPAMNAWHDVGAMSGDARIEEQGRTREIRPEVRQDATQARSQMTVQAFQELGGVLSQYELQKLIRLEGRQAEFEQLVQGGMSPEQALQQMIESGLGNAQLPWNEGALTFKTKVDALVQQQAPNMPQMAGTSGTTARMMEVGAICGIPQAEMLKAMLAMLLPIRAHSFQEVVRGSGTSAAFQGTVDDYTSVVPGVDSLDPTGFDKCKRSEAALRSGGAGGGDSGNGGA